MVRQLLPPDLADAAPAGEAAVPQASAQHQASGALTQDNPSQAARKVQDQDAALRRVVEAMTPAELDVPGELSLQLM